LKTEEPVSKKHPRFSVVLLDQWGDKQEVASRKVMIIFVGSTPTGAFGSRFVADQFVCRFLFPKFVSDSRKVMVTIL